ncbi:MAG: hypothetical protein R6W96_02215 [Clostridia bacterium]
MFWKKNKTEGSILVTRGRQEDTEAIHKEFHLATDLLLRYIHDKYGEKDVIAYLRSFAREYHGPMSFELSRGNLNVLVDYFEDIYGKEGGRIEMEFNARRLVLTIPLCPGVEYLDSIGKTPSEMHRHTYEVVFEAICEGTGVEYVLDRYNPETGGGIHIFTLKEVAS